MGPPFKLRVSTLATVLAAVAEGAGPDVSRTCSTFVSVNSSLEGVMWGAGSIGARSDVGGVRGISEVSMAAGGGGSPPTSLHSGSDVAATDGSTGASWLGAALGAFGAGAGVGLLKMLAQLRVPSGFEPGFGSSATGA